MEHSSDPLQQLLYSYLGIWSATKALQSWANKVLCSSLFHPLAVTSPGGGGKRVPESSPHPSLMFLSNQKYKS